MSGLNRIDTHAYRNPNREFTRYSTTKDNPVFFYDEFLGYQLLAYDSAGTTESYGIWETVEVNLNTAIAITDGVGGGVVTLPFDSDSNAEDAVLYWGNVRSINLKKAALFEARINFSVIPTTGVAAVFGMAGDHNLDKDTITEGAWFRLQASSSLLIETDDTTTNNDDKDTGQDLTAGDWHVYHIDFRDLTDVKFYMDGEPMVDTAASPVTAFDMSALTDAEALMQPYFSLDKASGTGVGTMQIDYVKIWHDR